MKSCFVARCGLVLLLAVVPLGASVLTFQISGMSNNQAIPQDYGDRIDSSFVFGSYTYGSAGGATPNVVVSYGPAAVTTGACPYPPVSSCVYWYQSSPGDNFGDLPYTIAQLGSGGNYGMVQIELTADPGYLVAFRALELAGWFPDTFLNTVVTVSDGFGSILGGPATVPVPGRTGTHLRVIAGTPIRASTLRILIDSSAILNGQGENVGVSNIEFSQEVVPEPATALLALSGLGVAVFARRRFKRS